MPGLNGLSHTKPSAEISRGLAPEGLASHFGDWPGVRRPRRSAPSPPRGLRRPRNSRCPPPPVPSYSAQQLAAPRCVRLLRYGAPACFSAAARSSPLRPAATPRARVCLRCSHPLRPAAARYAVALCAARRSPPLHPPAACSAASGLRCGPQQPAAACSFCHCCCSASPWPIRLAVVRSFALRARCCDSQLTHRIALRSAAPRCVLLLH